MTVVWNPGQGAISLGWLWNLSRARARAQEPASQQAAEIAKSIAIVLCAIFLHLAFSEHAGSFNSCKQTEYAHVQGQTVNAHTQTIQESVSQEG